MLCQIRLEITAFISRVPADNAVSTPKSRRSLTPRDRERNLYRKFGCLGNCDAQLARIFG